MPYIPSEKHSSSPLRSSAYDLLFDIPTLLSSQYLVLSSDGLFCAHTRTWYIIYIRWSSLCQTMELFVSSVFVSNVKLFVSSMELYYHILNTMSYMLYYLHQTWSSLCQTSSYQTMEQMEPWRASSERLRATLLGAEEALVYITCSVADVAAAARKMHYISKRTCQMVLKHVMFALHAASVAFRPALILSASPWSCVHVYMFPLSRGERERERPREI